jgi:hypothetical protein
MKVGDGTPGPGRKKGEPNKVTKATREAFQLLVDRNFDALQSWIERTAMDDPSKAFDMVMNLAGFCIPRLKSIEVTGEISMPQVVVNLTPPNGDPERAPE